MNPTASVMLVEDTIRPCKVEYDPDNQWNNKGAQHTQFFKCLDPTMKKGDLVIVSTTTRHGMTVAKITDIGAADVPVDFSNAAINWGWVIGPIPTEQYKTILETEKAIVGKVQEGYTNKLKAELKEAMGIDKVSFAGLSLTGPKAPAVDPQPAPKPPADYAPLPASQDDYGAKRPDHDFEPGDPDRF